MITEKSEQQPVENNQKVRQIYSQQGDRVKQILQKKKQNRVGGFSQDYEAFKKVEIFEDEPKLGREEVDLASELFLGTQGQGCEFSTLEFGLKGRLLYNKTDIRAKMNKMSIGRSSLLKQ